MSTLVWPPLPPHPGISPEDALKAEADATAARELAWLLQAIQDETLTALKKGLEECAALLAPREALPSQPQASANPAIPALPCTTVPRIAEETTTGESKAPSASTTTAPTSSKQVQRPTLKPPVTIPISSFLTATANPSGNTLVLSSRHSESLKGFVVLNGARITKGDITLRNLRHLPQPGTHSPITPTTTQSSSSLTATGATGGPLPNGGYKLTLSSRPTAPSLVVAQLVSARTLINLCLDVVDATRWTGDCTDAGYMSTQLRLLAENITDARAELIGPPGTTASESILSPTTPTTAAMAAALDASRKPQPLPLPRRFMVDVHKPKETQWATDPLDPGVFDPSLPPGVSVHFSIADAALVCTARTLEYIGPAAEVLRHHHGAAPPRPGSAGGASAVPAATGPGSFTGLSIRDRLAAALGAVVPPAAPGPHSRHDEMDDVFVLHREWHPRGPGGSVTPGGGPTITGAGHAGAAAGSGYASRVRVREKLRVETPDPSLLAALAKLGALGRTVALSRRALAVLMGNDGLDEEEGDDAAGV